MTHLRDCDAGPAWPSGCVSRCPRRAACFHRFPVNLAAVVAVSLVLRRFSRRCQRAEWGGVSDGSQASCRRRFQIVSPHLSPSSSCRLSIGQRRYLAAKTNCLAHKTNGPCTSVIMYTSLVSASKYGEKHWGCKEPSWHPEFIWGGAQLFVCCSFLRVAVGLCQITTTIGHLDRNRAEWSEVCWLFRLG